MPVMVPNPMRTVLMEALREVEPLVREIDERLERAYQEFHTGKVWNGPVARRFDAQLAHQRARARMCGDRILTELREALARTPSEVVEEVAQRLRAKYDLR